VIHHDEYDWPSRSLLAIVTVGDERADHLIACLKISEFVCQNPKHSQATETFLNSEVFAGTECVFDKMFDLLVVDKLQVSVECRRVVIWPYDRLLVDSPGWRASRFEEGRATTEDVFVDREGHSWFSNDDLEQLLKLESAQAFSALSHIS
jgi:hypothetical protein